MGVLGYQVPRGLITASDWMTPIGIIVAALVGIATLAAVVKKNWPRLALWVVTPFHWIGRPFHKVYTGARWVWRQLWTVNTIGPDGQLVSEVRGPITRRRQRRESGQARVIHRVVDPEFVRNRLAMEAQNTHLTRLATRLDSRLDQQHAAVTTVAVKVAGIEERLVGLVNPLIIDHTGNGDDR